MQEFLDLVGDHPLRVDHEIDRHVFAAEQVGPGVERVFTNARDLSVGLEHRVADLARDHVHFVVRRHGDQHVGVLDAGPAQHVGPRGVSLDGADVEAPPEFFEPAAVYVHHRDVERFARKVLRQRAAHLPRPQNEDVHASPTLSISAKKKPSEPSLRGRSRRPGPASRPHSAVIARAFAPGVCRMNPATTS